MVPSALVQVPEEPPGVVPEAEAPRGERTGAAAHSDSVLVN